jgi:DNA-binding NtrC family response regulator
VTLAIPPLRERNEDIAVLVESYLDYFRSHIRRNVTGITADALEALRHYEWPGNVRELVNILERAALLAGTDVIDAEHIIVQTRGASIPPEDRSVLVPFRDAKAKFETDYFRQLLTAAGGNVSLAAKLGHKTRKELYDALKRLSIDPDAYRPAGHIAPPEDEPTPTPRRRRAQREGD